MDNLKWYFPEKLDEAAGLLAKDGVIPHAGGTALVRRGVENVKGFVDLRRLGLDYFDTADGSVEIGAMQTFADVSENMKKVDAGSILPQALMSLPPALRNRITIGGSVAFFPPWSNIMGPLIALDSHVVLVGKNHGVYGIAEYAANNSLKSGSLIKGVRFKADNWKGLYFRAARTRFDYSGFNISFLMREKGGVIDDARFVVVGCKDKFTRLKGLENNLKGKKTGDVDIPKAVKDADLEFQPKKLGSPEYLRHMAMVEIERGLEGLIGSY